MPLNCPLTLDWTCAANGAELNMHRNRMRTNVSPTHFPFMVSPLVFRSFEAGGPTGWHRNLRSSVMEAKVLDQSDQAFRWICGLVWYRTELLAAQTTASVAEK